MMAISDPYLVLSHLRIAIRNALILFPTIFFIGIVTGWSLSQWHRTQVGAVLGALIGLGSFGWMTWLYSRTRGLLQLRESGESGP